MNSNTLLLVVGLGLAAYILLRPGGALAAGSAAPSTVYNIREQDVSASEAFLGGLGSGIGRGLEAVGEGFGKFVGGWGGAASSASEMASSYDF